MSTLVDEVRPIRLEEDEEEEEELPGEGLPEGEGPEDEGVGDLEEAPEGVFGNTDFDPDGKANEEGPDIDIDPEDMFETGD